MNAWTWLMQRVTAFILLIVLGLHIWFLHFAHGDDPLRYADITTRLGTPILIFLDILLLTCGLYHALYGVYSIFLDFGFGLRAKAVILGLLIIAGLGFFGFGIYGFWFFLV